jgi:L-alanine-DL-glutamate epimerase-like enolase superfamily enzyme
VKAPILSLAARKLDVPMKKPFGIAGGAQVEAKNVIVEIAAGTVRGLGEGAPFPAFNGETQDQVLAACARATSLLVGRDLYDDSDLRTRIREACAGAPSAVCAIETAIFDARARLEGVSLRTRFGGAEEELVTDVTITTGSVEDATREAQLFSSFRTLKIKVGGGALERDIARVLAVRTARPDARILVDANAGFSLDEALRFAAETKSTNIALFEQPILPGNWEALAEIKAKTGLTIAIDESVTRASDVADAKRTNAADAINLKIMKSGIFEALEIVATTKREGLVQMIGGMVETRMAMGMSACIAAGIGKFDFIDLDTPLFLASDPYNGGYAQDGERIDLRPIDVGHGLSLR